MTRRALALIVAMVCCACRTRPDAVASVRPVHDASVVCDPEPVCPEPLVAASVAPPGWDALRAQWIASPSFDLGAVNLAIAHAWDASVDLARERARLDEIAAQVRTGLPSHCDDRCRFEALRSHLFDTLHLRAEVDPTGMYRDIRRSLVPSVLDERIGYCEGIAYLMVAMGDRLGLALAIVPERQHVNVRFTPAHGTAIDVDPTREGRAITPTNDRAMCNAAAGTYGIPISRREAAGMMLGALAGRGGPFRRAWLDEAVDLAPRSPQVRNNRGVEREAQGDLSGALDDYRAAAALDPCVPFPFANQARVLARQGDHEASARVFDTLRSLAAQRGDAESTVSLALAEAETAVERGDDRAADAAFLRALQATPAQASIASQIARARQAQGRYREAADAWHTAAESSHDTSVQLAWIESLCEAGRGDEARVALRELESAHPTLPRWTLAHAMVALVEGRLDEARSSVRTCLAQARQGCARGLLVLAAIERHEHHEGCARRDEDAFLSCHFAVDSRRLRTLGDEVRRDRGPVAERDYGLGHMPGSQAAPH